MDIQNILSKSTALSADQLKSVLASTSAVRPMTVGAALSQKEYTSAEELVAALCQEMGVEFMKDIPVNDISSDLIRDIPINYSKSNAILPFKEDSDCVIALTANPVNIKALDDLQVIFGKKVRFVTATLSKLQDAINRVYEKSTANLSGLDEIEGEDYDLDDPIIDLLEAGEDDAPVIKLVNSLFYFVP